MVVAMNKAIISSWVQWRIREITVIKPSYDSPRNGIGVVGWIYFYAVYYVDTVGKNAKKIEEYIKHQLEEDQAGEQLTMGNIWMS